MRFVILGNEIPNGKVPRDRYAERSAAGDRGTRDGIQPDAPLRKDCNSHRERNCSRLSQYLPSTIHPQP